MNTRMCLLSIALAFGITDGAAVAAQKNKREPTREEKFSKEVQKLDREIQDLRAYADRQPAVLQEVGVCLNLAETLGRETSPRVARGDFYVAERLKDAGEDLVDAARYLANARLRLRWDDGRAQPPGDDDHDSRDAARELERAYFRTAQLNFLGRQPGAERMSDMAGLSRRFYQEGRSAFDRQEYFLARQLALASRNLSSAIESYVQSLLPADLPPPPKVPKR